MSRTLVVDNGCKKQVEQATPDGQSIEKVIQGARGVGKLSHGAGISQRGGKAPIQFNHDVGNGFL